MLFAGMKALAGTVVVDHARGACHQTKGSGPGLVPVCTRPCSWGKGGVRGLLPLPSQVFVGASPRACGAPSVFSGLSWAALCWYCCCCSVGVMVGVDAVVVGV